MSTQMGAFADTANDDYPVPFYCLPTKESELPFSKYIKMAAYVQINRYRYLQISTYI
jgi:hypothetical protein